MEIVGCQVCLKIIKSPSEGFFYNAIHNPGNVLVKDMLMGCVPGLLVERAHHVGICFSCMPSLTKAYEFQQQCMRSQYDVINYLTDRKLPDTSINIGEVATFYSSRAQIFEVVDESQIKMNYSCLLCTFSCTDHCTIRLHTILHNSKSGPYKCDQCPFIYPTADLLLQHIALHTGEKPYSCSLCKFGTSDVVELKEHNHAHRKPYQCNMCWIRFYEEYKMFRHMKHYHRKRYQVYFRCELCDYSGLDPDEMDSHINKTHKIFHCTFCPSEFVTSSAFNKHVASHNKSKTDVDDHKDGAQNISPKTANVFDIAVSKTSDSPLNIWETSAPLQSNNNINQFSSMGIPNANVQVIDTNWSLQNNNVKFEALNQISASVPNENVQAVNNNWSLQSNSNVKLEAPNQLGVALANVPKPNVQSICTNWTLPRNNNASFGTPMPFDGRVSTPNANVQAVDLNWSLQSNNVRFEPPSQLGVAVANIPNANVQAIDTNLSLQSDNNIRFEIPNQFDRIASILNANTDWSLQSNNIPANEFDVLASKLTENVQAIDAHKNDDTNNKSFKGKYRVFDEKTRSAASTSSSVKTSDNRRSYTEKNRDSISVESDKPNRSDKVKENSSPSPTNVDVGAKKFKNRRKQCKFCSFQCQSIMALEGHERLHSKVGSETGNKRATKSPAPASSELSGKDNKKRAKEVKEDSRRSKSKSLKSIRCKLCTFKCESDDVLKRHETAVHKGDRAKLKKPNRIPYKFRIKRKSGEIKKQNSDTADQIIIKQELNANDQKPVVTEIKAISELKIENEQTTFKPKPFKCGFCSYTYASKNSLKQHRKRAHRSEITAQHILEMSNARKKLEKYILVGGTKNSAT